MSDFCVGVATSCARHAAVRVADVSAIESCPVPGTVDASEYNQEAALIADYAERTLVERLRAATKAARVLQRLADAKTQGR